MARQTPLSCPGHTRPVVHLHYSDALADGQFYLISACKDGKPMLRKGDTGDWIGTFEGHKGAVWGASLTRDASLAATGAADFSAKLWKCESGTELTSFSHKHIVKSVDFSEDGSKLLTGCNDTLLRVFALGEGGAASVEPQVTLEGHSSAVKCGVWCSPNVAVSCAEENSIKMWDIRTSSTVKTLELNDPATSVELSRDRGLLTITHGNTITFATAEGLEKLKSFDVPSKMYSATLHPSRQCFVAGGEDFKVSKFDFEDGKELESYKGHFGPVHCVRYSPDGEVYCSGSEDGTVRLWLHTVGKTYGLWRSNSDPSANSNNNS